MSTIETYIPFDGFYNSLSESVIDDFMDRLDENVDSIIHASDYMDYKKAFDIVAREYATCFFQLLDEEYDIKIKHTFLELESPREYNFTTDKILVSIPEESLQKLFNSVDKETLKSVITERHSSNSGFISFYSNDINDWLSMPLHEWDYNHINTLLFAIFDNDNDLFLNVYYKVSDSILNNTSLESCLPRNYWEKYNAIYDKLNQEDDTL